MNKEPFLKCIEEKLYLIQIFLDKSTINDYIVTLMIGKILTDYYKVEKNI